MIARAALTDRRRLGHRAPLRQALDAIHAGGKGDRKGQEFLRPLGITQVEFARAIGVPLQRVNEIVKRKRGVTPFCLLPGSQSGSRSPQRVPYSG